MTTEKIEMFCGLSMKNNITAWQMRDFNYATEQRERKLNNFLIKYLYGAATADFTKNIFIVSTHFMFG